MSERPNAQAAPVRHRPSTAEDLSGITFDPLEGFTVVPEDDPFLLQGLIDPRSCQFD